MCIRKSSYYTNLYMTSIISVLCYAYTNMSLLKFYHLLSKILYKGVVALAQLYMWPKPLKNMSESKNPKL